MEREQKECVNQVAKLLAENKLREAFSLIDNYLSKVNVVIDWTQHFTTTSALFHRTEKAFRLGTISWEQYNISNSQVIVKALDLTNELCDFLKGKSKADEKEIRSGGATISGPPLQIIISRKLRKLTKEISTLSLK